ncbi:unnamed protein product [Calypogeia fissa]
MQRVANSIEEEMIVKAIREESPWEKLPKRLKLFLTSNEEYQKRVKEYCIKKRFKWSDCAARNACKENEYYEDLMRYLRKNLALFPYHLSENVCRILRTPPFQYYCEMLYEVMKNERPYDSIPNFSAADALRLTGIGRNEFIDIMNKCRAKKLMWKLNKSIARDMLPKVPVDFLIEPWWTVSIVNLTVEEFRKISDEEMVVIDKVGKEELNLVAELDLEIVRGLYRRGLIHLEVPVYPDDHFQVSTLDGFVSNRDQSYEDPTEELLYAVFVASSEQATISELAQTLQADLSQLEAAVSLASRLGWAKKVLDPASLLNDSQVPGSPLSEDGGADEGFRSFSSMPPSPLQEGMAEADGDVMKSQAGITRFALMVDANLTSYLMMGSLSPGLKGHAVTLYEAGKLGDTNVAEMCEDLRQVEGTKFEGELQELANHAFSLRLALECLRSGGTGLAGLDTADPEPDQESPEKSGTELVDFQLGPIAIGISSPPQLDNLPTFKLVDQDYSPPELQEKPREPDDDLFNFEVPSSKAADEHDRPTPLDISETMQSTSSSAATDVFGRARPRSKKSGRKYRVDVLRVESLQGLSPGTIHRVLRRDYDVVVSMIPLLSPPSVVSADGSGPVHFGPPSRAAITPWMKLLMYSVSGSGPVSVALIKGQRLRLLPPPLAGCAKALVWAWDGVGVSGIGGKFDGSLVEGRILLHCLNSLLKCSAVLVQPFPLASLDEKGSVLTKNAPLPLSNLNVLNTPDENDQAGDFSYMYQPSPSLLDVADELNLDTVGYIHMIRVRKATGALTSSPSEDDWDWIPQSVEFGLPLFDTKLCKLVCDGAVRSELFQSSTLSKHREAMQKLRRKLREFISDHQANGPISRLAYPGGPSKFDNKPVLMSLASTKWNPCDGMFDPLHSPTSALLSPSHSDFTGLFRTDGKVPLSPSFPLPPILQPAQQEAVVVPANSESSVQKMDYVEDDDGSDVPLPGVNLIFDGALLRPLNISLFLQGRLPVALVAEAAVASEVLRVAA